MHFVYRLSSVHLLASFKMNCDSLPNCIDIENPDSMMVVCSFQFALYTLLFWQLIRNVLHLSLLEYCEHESMIYVGHNHIHVRVTIWPQLFIHVLYVIYRVWVTIAILSFQKLCFFSFEPPEFYVVIGSRNLTLLKATFYIQLTTMKNHKIWRWHGWSTPVFLLHSKIETIMKTKIALSLLLLFRSLFPFTNFIFSVCTRSDFSNELLFNLYTCEWHSDKIACIIGMFFFYLSICPFWVETTWEFWKWIRMNKELIISVISVNVLHRMRFTNWIYTLKNEKQAW